MILVSVVLSRLAGLSSRIVKSLFIALFVLASSVLTIESLPRASALAATPTVIAPSPTTFSKNSANQEPGDFVIAHFGAGSQLLVSVDFVDPPTGTSFVFPTTTGLTAGYGYNFAGTNTQISFTATQADANTALAAMTVTTGSSSGKVTLRVSASLSTANVYFNPVNRHYYEYVSDAATTDCKEDVDATCITNIEDAITSKRLYGAQGYWATITSAQENTFIANKMDAPNIAIGLSDRETEETFKWLHGPEKGEAAFFSWAGNEPNNYDGCGTPSDEWFDPTCIPGEDYVVTNWNGGVGSWNDNGRPLHSRAYSYVVEYSSDCYSLNSGNCVSGTFPTSSQASASVISTVGWSFARPAVFQEGILLSSPQEMYTSSVSCSSPGNCAVVGQFRNNNGDLEAFSMTSTNDVWSTARPAVFDAGIQSNSPNAFLYSVSCSSPGNCTAVGSFKNVNDKTQAFTMTSTNGEFGKARPAQFNTADQNASPDDALFSVSCASPGNCTAVGIFLNSNDGSEAFTMTSTNDLWTKARPAVFDAGIQSNSPLALFNSVSCVSPGNCTAAGMFKNSSAGFEAFTMTSTNGVWDTARPAVVSAIQDEAKYGLFNSVSCASPGNCTAVGQVRNSNNVNEAFTMTSTNGMWDTAQPAVFDTGEQHVSRSGFFSSVSCASPGNCTAVGKFMNIDSEFEAFTMSIANGVWDLARPAQFSTDRQNTEPDDIFNSVSCATPGNCTAVGDFVNSSGSKTPFTYTSVNGVWGNAEPAEFSDGVRSNSGSTSFNSVSCSTPGNCTALGDFSKTEGGRAAFTATSVKRTSPPPEDGWGQARPAEFPNGLFGYSEIVVSSISCASPGNCTVVGGFQHIIYMQGFRAFTMTSTNGVWAPARAALFPDDVQARPDASFRSVSCASPGNCTAVGSFQNSNNGYEAFTMTSTNGAWALARPAVFPAGVQFTYPSARFSSVSCTSPGNCTAVGNYLNSGNSQEAFTMTSTNGAWDLARPAVFASGIQNDSPIAQFNSVSCASPRNCTAVGYFKTFDGSREAFTMTSTNGVWDLARPASFAEGVQPISRIADFNSVSCASPGNCTAVGRFNNMSDATEAFTMTMTNGVWALARPAVFASGIQNEFPNAQFNSVSCASPGNCTTVGNFSSRNSNNVAFTMTSTNGVWELARPAVFASGIQNDSPSDTFTSVSCASPGNCTAVGNYFNRNIYSQSAAFTMTSINGVWEIARPAVFASGVQSDSFSPSTFSSVSCASPGKCTAAGDFVMSPMAAGAMFTMTSNKTIPPASTTTTTPSTSTVPSPSTTVASPTNPTPTPVAPQINASPKMKVSTKYFGTLPMTGKDFGLTYYAIYILLIGMLIFLARKKLSN